MTARAARAAVAGCVALLAPLAVPGPAPAAAQRPLDARRLAAAGGPATYVHAEPSPLVALRLSFPVPTDAPEGIVELLKELARPGARAEADGLGASLELGHEAGHAVVAVAGPAPAFDLLVRILRRATDEPGLAVAELRAARARAEDRVLGRVERPGPRARLRLWHELFGGPAPARAAGTRADPESIRRWRTRLYRRDAGTLVIVGGVPPEAVRAALAGWLDAPDPAPPPTPGPTPGSPGGDGVAALAHHLWAGIGYRVRADAPALAVAAELVDRRVRGSALRAGSAEAWQAPAGGALVLIGAAAAGDGATLAAASPAPLVVRGAPDRDGRGDAGAVEAEGAEGAATVGAYLRRMIAEAAALTGPDDVERAAAALRSRLLREARSAPGKASVLGRLADALGSPEAAQPFLEALADVDLERVKALLEEALRSPAVLVGAAP